MIFSCWGSFQREVFWLKLILGERDDNVVHKKTMVHYIAADDNVDKTKRMIRSGTSSLSIVVESVNAPNWIFTHLNCIVKALYFICIAMHFLETHFTQKLFTSANARTKANWF